VLVSPRFPTSPSAILRRMQRMILPLRVLGRAGRTAARRSCRSRGSPPARGPSCAPGRPSGPVSRFCPVSWREWARVVEVCLEPGLTCLILPVGAADGEGDRDRAAGGVEGICAAPVAERQVPLRHRPTAGATSPSLRDGEDRPYRTSWISSLRHCS
jgi:hypothetical protein